KSFRKNCTTLIAWGECAIMGGLPALRNTIPIAECLEEAYLSGLTTKNNNPDRVMPNDEEIPMMLDRVFPIRELVKVDFFLPGCPPSADLIWNALTALTLGKEMDLPYEVIRYD
ncbi:MAG: NADP oxidoreductase, partial [Spirochaetia bacterium]